MTGTTQVHTGQLRQFGNNAIHVNGQPGDCLTQIQTSQDRLVFGQFLAHLAHTDSQSRQDSLFFAADLMNQGLHAVVAFQGCRRLKVKSLATGRDIVDKAFQMPAVIGSHRHDVTSVAISDQCFLEDPLKAFILQQFFQLTLDPPPLTLQAVAQLCQLKGRRVENLGTRTDTAPDFCRQFRNRS